MARKFAQILVTIWNDDDFLDLTVHEQWLYIHLTTHADLSYSGAMDWRPKRIVAKASGLTIADVELAAAVLRAKHYIVVDEDTEEVLVRSFMRNDGMLKQTNMGAAVAKAYASIGSRTITGVVVHELQRLQQENPLWGSWEALTDTLRKRSINPSEMVPDNPSRKGSVKGSGNPSDKGSDDPPF